MTIEIVNLWFSILVGSNIENHDCECLIFSFQFVIKIKWTKTTRTKKPIGILNLKLWIEFHLTPLNRYLRPQLSLISEETLIVSSVTRSSPLEMLSNPVNLPCGTKCWREFNIFWSGYFAFVSFIAIVIIIINIIIIIVIIIIIILLKLISAVVKDWFFSLGIYFCVFQDVARVQFLSLG